MRDEFSGAFITDFKMGDAFRVVELVLVVGEYTLLEQPAAQAFKCFGVIVHAFQKNALVQECPTAEFKLCENGGRFFVEFVGVVHVYHEHAIESCGEFAQKFKMLHHEVRSHDRESRVDAERRHRRVECDCFHEVAERSRAKREWVSAREDDFPNARMDIQPVRNFTRDILCVLEGVVAPKAEPAAHTAGRSRNDEGAVLVLLQDAFGLAGGEVPDGVIDKAGGFLELVFAR